ncbi:MAG: hypothetical protein QW555_07155, partial [Nitrososphaerota archaeon]
MGVSEAAKRLASRAIERGYQLTAETLNRLIKVENPQTLLDEFLAWLDEKRINQVIIDESLLGLFLSSRVKEAEKSVGESIPEVVVESPTYEDLMIEGVAEEQRLYLLSRFQSIRRVFEGRGLSFRPVRELMKEGGEGYVVGMVLSIRRRDTHFLIEMEDPVDVWNIFVPTRDRALAEKTEYLLQDMVVVFRARARKGLLIASDVYLPDIPSRRQTWRGPDVNVCIISDIHVGSRRHAAEKFRELIDWLRGSENEAEKTVLMIINGDLVDGVYVYPGQESELSLMSYADQF